MGTPKRPQTRQPVQNTDATLVQLSEEESLPILQSGEIIGGHRLPRGSNYAFLVALDAGAGRYIRAIYKPRDGERPLYDFPRGTLYKREYATFVLSRSLGWPDVPTTLIRDGPYGVGSMQLYVEYDPRVTYFDLIEDEAEKVQRFAVFDMLVNNADRKAGHCLLDEDGRIWSIDHGLTFHPVFKVRTVMLEFWGQPIPEPLLVDLKALVTKLKSPDGLAKNLAEALTPTEIQALTNRLHDMLENPVLPALDPYHDIPWPWV